MKGWELLISGCKEGPGVHLCSVVVIAFQEAERQHSLGSRTSTRLPPGEVPCWAQAPHPAGRQQKTLRLRQGRRGLSLLMLLVATFPFDVLMFQFWHPVRQGHQAACPSSLLTQLLAEVSRTSKAKNCPGRASQRFLTNVNGREGRREIKVGPTFEYGEEDKLGSPLLSSRLWHYLLRIRTLCVSCVLLLV